MADTSILVDIFIDKYLYHLPFHRVIQKYKELGVQLNDTTIYDWFAATCVRLRPIYEALRYCYTYLPRLARYILDGKYLLDNNKIESSIRPLAVGRNGYLFCDNHNSAIRAAIAYSLIGSCKNANIDPREWLTDVLNKSYKWELNPNN